MHGFAQLGTSLAQVVTVPAGPAIPRIAGTPVAVSAQGRTTGDATLAWTHDVSQPLTFATRPQVPTLPEDLATATELKLAPHAPGELTAVMVPYLGGVAIFHSQDLFVYPDLSSFGFPTQYRGSPIMLVRGTPYTSLEDVVGERGSPINYVFAMIGDSTASVLLENSDSVTISQVEPPLPE